MLPSVWTISARIGCVFSGNARQMQEIVDGVRHYALSGYQAAFTLGAIFLILGAYFLRNVRERREREQMAAMLSTSDAQEQT